MLLSACLPVNVTPIVLGGDGESGGTAGSGILTGVTCVADVNVTLRGVTHPAAAALEVKVDGPNGKSVTLFSGVGGATPLDSVDLTFDDEARAMVPAGGPVPAGTYMPTGGALSDFDRAAANGRWTLHVSDTGDAGSGGTVSGGWALAVTRCGQTLPAVLRSTDWFLRDSLSTGDPTTLLTFGNRPLTPLLGDWDGDGDATPGTFEGGVFLLTNLDDGPPVPTFTFGDRFGFPVAGDFDGDGNDDVAVYRDGTWEIRFIDDGTIALASFGMGGWPRTVPLAGDWDGDGVDGIGTWSAGAWTLRDAPAGDGAPDQTFTLGPDSQAYPVVGDWAGTGVDDPGVVAGGTWTVYFNDPFVLGDRHSVYTTFEFGQPNDLPLAGP